ncbi:hypothetical protein Mnod_5405 [Methylobacterium nodulans ORS 2060]|uniref:Uncharacterized protein n=2 Tax=Methylobacterium nodulans TaxID=114616 RepID=B8IMQ6_METNO|nr:hypothetical protein Mnod_5405 [Methylobacterium nodulans ORS 2060]
MNSGTFDRVARAFRCRPPLDLVAVARCVARGHAAHALILQEAKVAPAQADRHRGRIEQTQALEQFWASVGLYVALGDLVEEHDGALPSCLRSDLVRAMERAARDIADPLGEGYVPPPLRALLPPREHLPNCLPEALTAVFGLTSARVPALTAA